MDNKIIIKNAKGVCESCGSEAPFEVKGVPYLEVIKISVDKGETEENLAAICPNCHTKLVKLKDETVIEKIRDNREQLPYSNDAMFSAEIKKIVSESSDFKLEVGKQVRRLIRACSDANSESTVASRFENTLTNLLSWYGLEYEPIREERVIERTIKLNKQKTKRLDSRFRNIITEYKKDLSVEDLEECIEQLEGYILGISETEDIPLEKFFGVLTDGRRILFVSYLKEESYKSILHPMTDVTMIELLKVYLSLERKELTPQRLVDDFSLEKNGSPTVKLVRSLYTELSNEEHNEFKYDSDWEKLFRLGAHNENNMKAIKERKCALATILDVGEASLDETKALFTLHTAYTIIVKLIAFRVVTDILMQEKRPLFEELSSLTSKDLRSRLLRLENGEIFKELGIRNLLEGDFFSWYLDENIWNDSLHSCITDCIGLLSEYDTNRNLFKKKSSGDLFRRLYETMIPREVRHSLGEFYTESWLADKTTRHSLDLVQVANWRGIDVCAGSGTFILKMIETVLSEFEPDYSRQLSNVLRRVNAIDINPLAVLTCRVNYFFAISPLISIESIMTKSKIEIPVYLGDSALAPQIIKVDGIDCVQYEIVNGNERKLSLPVDVLSNIDDDLVESHIKNGNDNLAESYLTEILSQNYPVDFTKEITCNFIKNIREMLNHGFNLVWVRSILSILRTRAIGKFDIIVSNPPWIDWKVLPDGYRDILKKACIESHIFSGDNFTGGINLNICVLITNVAINTWLKEDGIMGVLMPKAIAFQQSYAGFRNLVTSEGQAINYVAFDDWSNAGHPFHPVTEKFLVYYFTKGGNELEIVPLTSYDKKRRMNIRDKHYESYSEIEHKFDEKEKFAFKATSEFNNFTITEDESSITQMRRIAGISSYVGRVGLGIYPKDMLLFEVDMEKTSELNTDFEKLYLVRHSSSKTERQYSSIDVIMESKLMYPVIESPNIGRFKLFDTPFYAPLPYSPEILKKPIEREELRKVSPLLVKYYEDNESELTKTDYNKRLQGKKGDFYSMTRVGKYTFAPVRVVFRNNSKWVSTVIEDSITAWGESKMYLLLDHACSVSQRSDGSYISVDEAHYICAILNSKVAEQYVLSSSDSRSFRALFQLKVVEYDSSNPIHISLSDLSKEAHDMSELTVDFENRLEKSMNHYLDEVNS